MDNNIFQKLQNDSKTYVLYTIYLYITLYACMYVTKE